MMCTKIFLVPDAPYISEQDQLTAAIVNQTSVTLIGSLMNTSDTYAVIGLFQNGTRIENFTRVQSESADDNVILGNLTAGTSYKVEVVSVIGTNTDCGGNSTDSEIVSFNLCTGKKSHCLDSYLSRP